MAKSPSDGWALVALCKGQEGRIRELEGEIERLRAALAVPEGESLLDHIRLHLEEHAKCSTGLDKLAEEVRAARLALQSKGLNELAAEGQWIELTGKQDADAFDTMVCRIMRSERNAQCLQKTNRSEADE